MTEVDARGSSYAMVTSRYDSSTTANVSHDGVNRETNPNNGLDIHPETIVIITSILLSGIVAVTLVVLMFTILYRRRRENKKRSMKLKIPSLEDIEKEYDVINGVSQENVDVLFDKKSFKKTAKSKKRDSTKRSSPRKCRVCLDRGHKQCQGHSRISPTGSISSVNREHLNFIEPSGFYEHIKVQTEAAIPDVHEYAKLDHATSGPLVPPQPLPRQARQPANTQNLYANLHETTSGGGQIPFGKAIEEDSADSEYEYSVPLDHYEELPHCHYDKPSSNRSTTCVPMDHLQVPDIGHYKNVSNTTHQH